MLLILAGLICSSCSPGKQPQVQRQDLQVRVFPERHLLSGSSSCSLAGGSGPALFRLSREARITAVEAAGKRLQYSFKKGILTVELPRDKQNVLIKVTWEVSFRDRAAAGPDGEDPSFGVVGSITERGVFLAGEADWYPRPLSLPPERGITVQTPEGLQAITFGRRVSSDTSGGVTTSVWDERHPVEALSLSAGHYHVDERNVDGITLYSYFSSDNAPLAPAYLDAAARYLRLYSDLLGPYPYEKFAIVENFLPTGYAFPSYTLLGGAVIRLPFILDTSLPHEIAHNWWGNGVLVDAGGGNWSEGLATYLADYLLKQRRSPEEGREYRSRLVSDYAALVKSEDEFELRHFMSRSNRATRAIGYGKGAMVFHMAAREMGEEAFLRALRKVSTERMYRHASWDDFIREFSASSGKDMSHLRQWLDRTGGPRLVLADVALRRRDSGWQVSGVIRQDEPPYRLDVPLRIDTPQGSIYRTFSVSATQTAFQLTVSAKPESLALDPDSHIFRILPPAQLPPSISRIKGGRQIIAVMTPDCRIDAAAVRSLLDGLGRPEAPLIPEERLKLTELAGKDLLFCGVPRRWQFPLPSGFSVSPGGFKVAGHAFDGTALLFLVVPNPADAGHVAALLLPTSADASSYLPRIPHYGTYSYLALQEGRVPLKGILPPAETATITFGPGDHP